MIDERVLLGLPVRTRTEECACGGLIAVRIGGDVEAAVRAHNKTREHRRWRELRENEPFVLVRRGPSRSAARREYDAERQRARRARLVAAGLTTEGTVPIPRRRVHSWATGPFHLPERGPTGLCVHGCGRRVSRNGHGGWRHR